MPNPSASSPPPLPPPAPAAAAARRRRRRLLPSPNPSTAATSSSSSSSSSSSASSNLSFSFPSFSPAPSPFHHRFLSPLRASAVPFSWEHRPGIPKTPARTTPRTKPGAKLKPPPPLPLPPSLHVHSNNKVVAEYPFATAGADYFVISPENNTKARRSRRRMRRQQQQQQRRRRYWPAVTDALADWLAVLSLYRSCTRSRDFLAATAGPPPRRQRAPA